MTDERQRLIDLASQKFRRNSVNSARAFNDNVPTFDRAAMADRAESELGVAPVAAANLPDLEDLLKRREFEKTTTGFPKTATFLTRDYINSALGRDDAPKLTALEKTGNEVARGFIDFGVGAYPRIAEGALEFTTEDDRIAAMPVEQYISENFPAEDREALRSRGAFADIARKEADLMRRHKEARDRQLLRGGPVDREESMREIFTTVGEWSEYAQSLEGFEQAKRFAEGPLAEVDKQEGTAAQVMHFFKVFAENPEDGAVFVLSTLARSSPGLIVGGSVGAVTRSPFLASTTMGYVSGTTEAGGKSLEFLAEKGFDLAKPEDVERLLSNPEIWREAQTKGLHKGLVVGVLDALSGGIAGRALAKTPVGDVLAQFLAQGFIGAVGDGLGDIAAGDDPSVANMLVEFMVEGVPAPVEVAAIGGRTAFGSPAGRTVRSAAARLIHKDTARYVRGAQAKAKADEAVAAARETRIREASRGRFKQFLDETDWADASLYVDSDKLRTFFQETGTRPEDFGIDPDEVAVAAESGAEVAIPATTYFDTIIDSEHAGWFGENGTFSDEAATPAEMAEIDQRIRQTIEEEVARVDAEISDTASEATQAERVESEIRRSLLNAGQSSQQADTNAAVLSSFYRTQAAEMGVDPVQLWQEDRVRIEGPRGDPVQAQRAGLGRALNILRGMEAGTVAEAPPGLAEPLQALRSELDRMGVSLEAPNEEIIDRALADVESRRAERGGDTIGSAAGAGRTFQQVYGREDYAPETDPSPTKDRRISTRFPEQARSPEDPLAETLQVDTEAMKAAPAAFEHNMSLVVEYPGMKDITGTPDEIAAEFRRRVKENLLWLYDKAPEILKTRGWHWYDGARRLTDTWSARYGLPDHSIAGVLAALSPQKDWFQNVSLAERVLDIMTGARDVKWDGRMTRKWNSIGALAKYADYLKAIKGRTLQEVIETGNDTLVAAWVRTYDETYNDRAYTELTPEGDILDATGRKVAWGSLGEIGKAVSVIMDPTVENVSRQMGSMHKVRSFYNNIVSPNSTAGDVTIDTHAVAAALVRPLSQSSPEVSHAFGSALAPNKQPEGYRAARQAGIAGVKGTYGLYADAYRDAAAELGLLPRQLQSITWEAVRLLYPDAQKRGKMGTAVEAIWRGQQTIEEKRDAAYERAGGIGRPAWDRPDTRPHDPGGRATYEGPLSLDGRADRGRDDAGARSRAARAVPDDGDRAAARGAAAAGDGERGRSEGRALAPLEGAPVVKGAAGPDPRLVDIAERYADANGIDYRRQGEFVEVDEARAKRIADAYEAMEHAPQNPAVAEAYDNLIEQTMAQYRALEEAGYRFWLHDEASDPYGGNPWNAMRDLRANQSMAVFSTEAGFGTDENFDPADNPMLRDTGIKWPFGAPDGPLRTVYANDLFRAVHDAFGHGLEGSGFRARGEENAWQAHVRLFTGSAVAAITSETRGQNSWLNYGPHGETNRTAKVEDTVFADQKTGLMPEWTWTEGRAPDAAPAGRTMMQMAAPAQSPQLEDLARLIEEGAEPRSLLDHPAFIEAEAAMAAIPSTETMEGFGTPEFFASREYVSPSGTRLRGVKELLRVADEVSAEYAGGPIRQEKRMDILLGPPAAGKSTLAEKMATHTGSRIIDSDDIKKMVPEFAGGIGAAAVHEESSIINGMHLEVAARRGDNIILPKVGDNPSKIAGLVANYRAMGYNVNVVVMEVAPEEAFRRMAMRFIQTGRLIPPEYVLAVGDRPVKSYEAVKGKGEADGYAKINNDQPFGQDPTVVEDTAGVARGLVATGPQGEDQRADRGVEIGGEPVTLFQTAFHGSPHIFERFSLDFMGTGEGAQAVGWGLYFADMKEVAETYRPHRKGRDEYVEIDVGDGTRAPIFFPSDAGRYAGMIAAQSGGRRNSTIVEEAVRIYSEEKGKIERGDLADRTTAALQEKFGQAPDDGAVRTEVDALFDVHGMNYEREGRTYEVDIPERSEMLKWDAPLSEQPDILNKVKARWDETIGDPDIIMEQAGLTEGSTGADLYRALAGVAGNDRQASLWLRDAGIPGHMFLDRHSRAKGTGSYNYVIYDDSRIAIRAFEQRGQEAQGSFTLPDMGLGSGDAVIKLFRLDNPTTFAHESAHLMLESFRRMAARPDATDSMRARLAAINEFVGNDGASPYTTEQHEKFARSWEAYLMEGKAPSLALLDVFDRFRAWMISAYRTLAGLAQQAGFNVGLNPEIRDVMDRMIASDAEIREARAEAGMRPLFETPPPGMSADTYGAYSRMAERGASEANAKMLAATMAAVRRKRTKWWKEERAELRRQVEARANAEPRYRLIEALGNGRHWTEDGWIDVDDLRMDKDQLVERFGPEILDDLSRDKIGGRGALWGGEMDIDAAAQFFGYERAEDMVADLRPAQKREAYIEGETDRIMIERHGDVLNDGSIEEEALAAVHSEQQAKVVAAEVRHLAGMTGRDRRDRTARIYKLRARRIIAGMQVRHAIRPDNFLRAERKAAREAEAAFRKVAAGTGDQTAALDAAWQAKERQLLNHYLYMEARDFANYVRVNRERMRSYSRRSVREKIGDPYIRQIDRLLVDTDFRVATQRSIDQRTDLRQFVEEMEEAGREAEMNIDPRLIDPDGRRHYTRMTVDEMRGLVDTVNNIAHLGRTSTQLRYAQRQADLQQTAGAVATTIEQNLGTGRTASNRGARRSLRAGVNTILNVDTMLVEHDGGDEMGTIYDAIKRPIDEAANVEQEMFVELRQRFDDIFSVYTATELAGWKQARVVEGGNGYAWSKGEIIALALNTGTESNLQRVLSENAHPTRHLTQSQLDALLATLDKRDWDFVQSMWDLFESYWPMLAQVEQRRTNVRPDKVPPRPVETAYGRYRGGYYPLKYDPTLGVMAQRDEQSATERFMTAGHTARAAVNNGMTKARQPTGGDRTVDYSIEIPFGALRDTIRLIAMSEAIDATWRLINHPIVGNAYTEAGRQADLDTLKVWLQDVASGPIYHRDFFNGTARFIKNNFVMSRLALNLKTVALQVTGLTQAATVVGKARLLRGVMSAIGGTVTIDQIVAKSSFMAERQTTFQKDIQDFANDVRVSSPVASRYGKAMDVIRKAGFWPIVKTQFLLVDVPTWIAGYEMGLARYPNDDARAVAFADRMVARSQASGLMQDRSALERGTISQKGRQLDLVRVWTALGSYMITKLNRARVEGLRFQRALQGREPGVVALDAAANLMILYLAEGIIMGLAYGMMLDDDDDDEDNAFAQYVLSEGLSSLTGGIPLIREAVSKARGFEAGGVMGAGLGAAGGLWQQAAQGEIDRGFVRALGDAIGIATGLPTTQALRFINGLTSEDEVPFSEMMFGRNPLR